MASTNKTSNYELSQFVGSDKPAWLSDYNGDMSKIDTGIHNAQTTATGADGKADANTTNIGNLGYLSTTNKTDLVSAINEVDGNADTAQNTANSASDGVSANAITIQAIKDYLNVQTSGSNLTVTTNSGTINVTGTVIKSAANTDGSLGKIYGKLIINQPRSTSTKITFSDTGLRPTENINILGLVTIVVYAYNGAGSSSINYVTTTPITIKTDGTAEISIEGTSIVDHADIFLPPCLLFMQNFED